MSGFDGRFPPRRRIRDELPQIISCRNCSLRLILFIFGRIRRTNENMVQTIRDILAFQRHLLDLAADRTSLLYRIRTVTVTCNHTDVNSKCAVCWEEFVLEERVCQLPCSHIFHKECIRRWFTMRENCPVCRHNMEAALLTDEDILYILHHWQNNLSRTRNESNLQGTSSGSSVMRAESSSASLSNDSAQDSTTTNSVVTTVAGEHNLSTNNSSVPTFAATDNAPREQDSAFDEITGSGLTRRPTSAPDQTTDPSTAGGDLHAPSPSSTWDTIGWATQFARETSDPDIGISQPSISRDSNTAESTAISAWTAHVSTPRDPTTDSSTNGENLNIYSTSTADETGGSWNTQAFTPLGFIANPVNINGDWYVPFPSYIWNPTPGGIVTGEGWRTYPLSEGVPAGGWEVQLPPFCRGSMLHAIPTVEDWNAHGGAWNTHFVPYQWGRPVNVIYSGGGWNENSITSRHPFPHSSNAGGVWNAQPAPHGWGPTFAIPNGGDWTSETLTSDGAFIESINTRGGYHTNLPLDTWNPVIDAITPVGLWNTLPFTGNPVVYPINAEGSWNEGGYSAQSATIWAPAAGANMSGDRFNENLQARGLGSTSVEGSCYVHPSTAGLPITSSVSNGGRWNGHPQVIAWGPTTVECWNASSCTMRGSIASNAEHWNVCPQPHGWNWSTNASLRMPGLISDESLSRESWTVQSSTARDFVAGSFPGEGWPTHPPPRSWGAVSNIGVHRGTWNAEPFTPPDLTTSSISIEQSWGEHIQPGTWRSISSRTATETNFRSQFTARGSIDSQVTSMGRWDEHLQSPAWNSTSNTTGASWNSSGHFPPNGHPFTRTNINTQRWSEHS